MLTHTVFALAFLTLALLAVLILRRPVRRLFGGTNRVLAMAAAGADAYRKLDSTQRAMVAACSAGGGVGDRDRCRRAPDAGRAPVLIMPLWLLGVAARLAQLALGYWRFSRGLGDVPEAMRKTLLRDANVTRLPALRMHHAGPALAPSLRGATLLLPADFMQRFNAVERALILQHELTHLRRGDMLWNALAEIALVLLWFHPLAWLARPRFRVDEELACDEAVLRRQPDDAGRYARTLLHSVLPPSDAAMAPGLIPWLDEPSPKERLIMINRQHAGPQRRYDGLVAIALLLGSGVALAQTGAHAVSASNVGKIISDPATQDVSFNSKVPPHYPVVSIKQKEQGIVILIVHVGDLRRCAQHDRFGQSDQRGDAGGNEMAVQPKKKRRLRGGWPDTSSVQFFVA